MSVRKPNCWENLKCGREPGGAKSGQLGVCPAATEHRMDGINGGTNGGRACWAVAGTLCGGKVRGTYATKKDNCLMCTFYQMVRDEEGEDFAPWRKILPLIK